jgi:hypothetical protein
MIKIKQLSTPLIVILLFIVFVFVYITRPREKFNGNPTIPAITGGNYIEVKHIFQDNNSLLTSPTFSGYTNQIGDYTIHRGLVNTDGNNIAWTEMKLRTKDDVDVHTWFAADNTPEWNKEWMGTGTTPPTKFGRFPTLAQLISGDQPLRVWSSGKIFENAWVGDAAIPGNGGVNGDTCSYKKSDGSGEILDTVDHNGWWCRRSHPDGYVITDQAKAGDVCDSKLDLVIPISGDWYCPSTLRYEIGSGTTWGVVTTEF